jgi:hypothetical protein
MYKYLRDTGLLDTDGVLIQPTSVDVHILNHVSTREKRLAVIGSFESRATKAASDCGTFAKLIRAEEPHNVLNFLPALADKLNPAELKAFLLKHERLRQDDSHRSQWIKMVCLYDWLVYGKQQEPNGQRRRRDKRTKPSSSRSAKKKE